MIRQFFFIALFVGMSLAQADTDFDVILANYEWKGKPTFPYLDLVVKGLLFVFVKIANFGKEIGYYLIPFNFVIGFIMLILAITWPLTIYIPILIYFLITERKLIFKRWLP